MFVCDPWKELDVHEMPNVRPCAMKQQSAQTTGDIEDQDENTPVAVA